MINFVLKKFVKKLNNVSLSSAERASLRKDFLARTGLPAVTEHSSLKSSFVIASPKAQSSNPIDGKVNFELHLVEGCPCETEKQGNETKIEPIKDNVMMKVKLNILDEDKEDKTNKQVVTPTSSVVIKVVKAPALE